MKPPATDVYLYKFYLDIAQFAMTGALGVYVWISTRARVNQKRFRELEKSVEQKISGDDVQAMLDQQLPDCTEPLSHLRAVEAIAARLGTEIRDRPQHQDLAKIGRDLSQIYSKVALLEGRFEGIDRLTNLLNEFMLNQGGHK